MTEFTRDRILRTEDTPTKTTLTHGEITYVVKSGNLYVPAGCLIAPCPLGTHIGLGAAEFFNRPDLQLIESTADLPEALPPSRGLDKSIA
jgi:hypothetical protein